MVWDDNVPQPGKTFIIELNKNNEPVGDPVLISNNGYGGGISTRRALPLHGV